MLGLIVLFDCFLREKVIDEKKGEGSIGWRVSSSMQRS